MNAQQIPHIARIAEETVLNLKDLEFRIEGLKNALAQVCVVVGNPQAAQLAVTPVATLQMGVQQGFGAPIGQGYGQIYGQTYGQGYGQGYGRGMPAFGMMGMAQQMGAIHPGMTQGLGNLGGVGMPGMVGIGLPYGMFQR